MLFLAMGFGLLLCFGVATHMLSPCKTPATISFSHYTNALDGMCPEAVFLLTNNTGSPIMCEGRISTVTPVKADDIRASLVFGTIEVEAHGTKLLGVAYRGRSNEFRAVMFVTIPRPATQRKVVALLDRIGVHIEQDGYLTDLKAPREPRTRISIGSPHWGSSATERTFLYTNVWVHATIFGQ